MNRKPPIRFRLKLAKPETRPSHGVVAHVMATVFGLLLFIGGLVLSVVWFENGPQILVPWGGVAVIVGLAMIWLGLAPSEATLGGLILELLIQMLTLFH